MGLFVTSQLNVNWFESDLTLVIGLLKQTEKVT